LSKNLILKECTLIPHSLLGPLILGRVKDLLTIKNPKFISSLKLNIPTREPPLLRYYDETKEYLQVPIGATASVLEIIGDDYDIVDERNEKELEVPYETKFELRDYQKKAMESLKGRTVGVVEAPTGSGKTIIILELIKQKRQNTLILVDTVELLIQCRTRLVEYTNLEDSDIGYVGNGKKIWKPITVGLLQTMRNLEEEEREYVSKNVGLLISDEVHVVKVLTFHLNFLILYI
jgi:superfamily II DNA or RNA helicase